MDWEVPQESWEGLFQHKWRYIPVCVRWINCLKLNEKKNEQMPRIALGRQTTRDNFPNSIGRRTLYDFKAKKETPYVYLTETIPNDWSNQTFPRLPLHVNCQLMGFRDFFMWKGASKLTPNYPKGNRFSTAVEFK